MKILKNALIFLGLLLLCNCGFGQQYQLWMNKHLKKLDFVQDSAILMNGTFVRPKFDHGKLCTPNIPLRCPTTCCRVISID